ncbi:MAG: hypothetical protein KIT11_00725 [Fimbriimonadaceae bacterium]|nr:hypothetical protein [Fimbriimonadaceae bacterium]QYK55103.1 MAG: hypothetical protein KF733_08810 [Fimbriimonadaceae bacterium]
MQFTRITVGTALISAALGATAQSITVQVDGERVYFKTEQPQMVRGRILVPLRGVLEKLGAKVSWEDRTETATAERNGTSIKVRIGSDFATVGDKVMQLDQAPMIINATTMVPLRFMSEALGAQVRWEESTRTVTITTSGTGGGLGTGGTGGGTGTGLARITNVEVPTRQWLTSNGNLEVIVRGSPGANVTATLVGVQTDVALTESPSGVYRGTIIVPSGDSKPLTLEDASIIATLNRGSDRAVAQGGSVRIDNVRPTYSSMSPGEGAQVGTLRPTISLAYSDGAGSGVTTRGMKVMVDGVDVTAQAKLTETSMTYTPAADMKAGVHTVEVQVRDVAGNVNRATWSFTTLPGAAGMIESFSHNGIRTLKPGDVIQFNVVGRAGSSAVVHLQKNDREIPLREISTGKYRGEYTVRGDDDINGEVATVTLTNSNNQTTTMQASYEVGKAANQQFSAPVLNGLENNAQVTSPLTIRGRAPGASAVVLKISYKTEVERGVVLRGVLTSVAVQTNENGAFESEPIELTTPVRGQNTTYTIEATALRQNGDRSKATTVTVRS